MRRHLRSFPVNAPVSPWGLYKSNDEQTYSDDVCRRGGGRSGRVGRARATGLLSVDRGHLFVRAAAVPARQRRDVVGEAAPCARIAPCIRGRRLARDPDPDHAVGDPTRVRRTGGPAQVHRLRSQPPRLAVPGSGAKARALLAGRFHVDFADLKALAAPVLRHRLVLNFHARADKVDADALVARLLASVPQEG